MEVNTYDVTTIEASAVTGKIALFREEASDTKSRVHQLGGSVEEP